MARVGDFLTTMQASVPVSLTLVAGNPTSQPRSFAWFVRSSRRIDSGLNPHQASAASRSAASRVLDHPTISGRSASHTSYIQPLALAYMRINFISSPPHCAAIERMQR
jgi:hypothetical protein